MHTSAYLSANRFFYPTQFSSPPSASCVISRYLRSHFHFSANRLFLLFLRCPSIVHLSFFLYIFFVSFCTSHIHTALSFHNKCRSFACRVLVQNSLRKHPRELRHPSWGLRRDKPPPGISDCLDLYAMHRRRPWSRSRFSHTSDGTRHLRIDRSILPSDSKYR